MKNRRFIMMVAVAVLFAGMQTYAQSEKDAGALMSDIMTIVANSKANVAAAAGTEGAETANAIDVAVKKAANAALVAYNALVENVKAGNVDEAASAFEELQQAVQAAQDAMNGNLPASEEQPASGSGSKTDSSNTGGQSSSTGDTNVEVDLSDPEFVQKFKQKQSSIYHLSTAFGGDGLGYKFATPE